MKFSLRLIASVALFACVGLVAGCGSNNKGKIEGKWRIVSFPEKTNAKDKATFADMEKMGVYLAIEYRADGTMSFGIDSDKPELLKAIKMMAGGKATNWDMKYKLLSGDSVEIYDMPKDIQTEGGGLFGKKDRAKVSVKITGDDMAMTDDEGTAKLTKVK